MEKTAEAFRTISEVADWLEVPTHVLRFWESQFSQIKPVKRAGGRRYYRPKDMLLIGGIKKLLHEDGEGISRLIRKRSMLNIHFMSHDTQFGGGLNAGDSAFAHSYLKLVGENCKHHT